MVPAGVVEDLGAGCFVVGVVSRAGDAEPAEAASRRSVKVALNFLVNFMEMRRSDIYCTPVGLAALAGGLEVSEMAAGGSFG
jgi:hypothetical protein